MWTVTRTLIIVSAAGGYKDAGYEYINLDDCWMSRERDAQGRLQPDPKRFPSGIKNLADYVHAKGLKLGIYQDMGTETCDGFPGIWGHIETDAQTYAEWGVDYVKMDGCHNLGPTLFPEGFINMSRALNATGRPFIFSCEWGLYQPNPNYTDIARHCNTMRNYLDIQDSWVEMLSVLDWYVSKQDDFYKVNGPGSFIDMDFLVVGDFSLSFEQAQSQMALWSIMSSQLIMSSDLRKMDPKMKEILLNYEVIAVNQDQLGKMGRRIYNRGSFQVWTKELDKGCYATVILRRATNMPQNFTTSMKGLGFSGSAYSVRDLFKHRDLGVLGPTDPLSVTVNPGGVVMIKASPMETKRHFKVY
ncbi:alpha-N-acetylgalactosaminidase-like isoform X2 [Acanthaster planci]|uniref:Alpha-galactosidase n=1 Tax=Acanthaster planci TaxID=133434 RepID=A0A8B7YIY4_ACAPL|nr:alpha-N-acetylgalactosaminidase-like isoform X2 [Acanthaster planci]